MTSLVAFAASAALLCLGGLPLAGAQIQGLSLKRDKLQRVVAEVNPPVLDVSDGLKTYCEQKLDHFDPENKVTWCQRYTTNRTYWKKGGPVFVCIDGEDYPWGGTRKPYTLMCNNMMELAKEFNAMGMAVEHRYYGGKAFDGVPDFSAAHLKYHSSRQALADLAGIHDFIVATASFEVEGVPWVVFGGSYPGSLSAWARLLYPERFAASVASSAPLKAQLDFSGYNAVVSSAIAAPSVGGTPECLATVAKGHAEIGDLLESERGRRSLERKFKICGTNALDNIDNRAQWAGTDGVVAIVPQYNSAKCNHTSCNMKLFCGNLSQMARSTESTSALDAIVLMKEHQDYEDALGGHAPSPCTSVSFENLTIKAMNITTKVDVNDARSGDQFSRLWYYQTCTEFGWYQTCQTGSNCPWTQGYNTVEWNLKPCELLFGIPPEEVAENIRKTNEFYHGILYPNTTRTIFPNGEVDPWHWESVLEHPNPEIDTIFVKGASHCEWMHAVRPSMSQHLVVAKKAIQNKIASWLRHPEVALAATGDLHSIRQRKFLASDLDVDMVSHLQTAQTHEVRAEEL